MSIRLTEIFDASDPSNAVSAPAAACRLPAASAVWSALPNEISPKKESLGISIDVDKRQVLDAMEACEKKAEGKL